MKKDKQRKSLGQHIIESLEEIQRNPHSLKVLKAKINIKKLRKALGLTQKEFAETYGFNLETLRKWEQGLYTPDQGVTSYLSCISKKPDAIKKILNT